MFVQTGPLDIAAAVSFVGQDCFTIHWEGNSFKSLIMTKGELSMTLYVHM